VPSWVRLVRRFLADSLPDAGQLVVLSAERSHHLLRVTGIGPGESVELFDGKGVCCRAELVDLDEGLARLRVHERLDPAPTPASVHLMVAQTRATVMDTVVRMATELGVEAVSVVHSERCVAKGNKRDRWLRIAESAAAQSGRAAVPTIRGPQPLMLALQSVTGPRIICVPGVPSSRVAGEGITILLGPEGGFSEAEVASAIRCGWEPVGLGSTVLRADTAAVAAVVQYGQVKSS